MQRVFTGTTFGPAFVYHGNKYLPISSMPLTLGEIDEEFIVTLVALKISGDIGWSSI